MNPIRRFVADLLGAYADGVRTVRGLPWLFGAIIAWEFAQHVVEYRIGFFVDRATAKAVSLDGSRMILGWIKMLLVYAGGFVTIRYLVLGRHAALRPHTLTLLRYAPYVAYAMLLFALIFYAAQLVGPAQAGTLRAVVGLGQVAVEPLLMVWIVCAATDGPVQGPIRSARVTGLLYIRAFALFFVGRLPIGLVHQWLGLYPIGKPDWLLWPMLALDAIAVGLLIAIIPALYVRIVRHIAQERPGLALLPGPAAD